ncbi:MAG: M20/M25/M40 family metallo-hydrolase [Steroidobacteraceae bacterium]
MFKRVVQVFGVLLWFLGWSVHAHAAAQGTVDKAVEILGRSVGFDTVAGRGKVPAYAAYLRDELLAAGFAPGDVQVEPFGETATLTAYLRGRSHTAPIVLNAHMDVVEADPKDWIRNPFVMETDGQYFYGRGVLDNKFGLTMLVTTLITLKNEHFVPAHDLILVLTGDEETTQATAAAIAPRFKGARFVLNADAGGGTLGDDGQPLYYSLQAGEKTYADFKVTVTNPGGHSSRPTAHNAIVDMAGALSRVAAFQFPAERSELTQAYFRETARQVPGELGAAMARFAADPDDAAAVAELSSRPEYVGQIRTTCVPTMINGGHAENALPQRVVANINCRIFPGNAPEAIRRKLQELVGDAGDVSLPAEFPKSEVSPLDARLLKAVRAAVDLRQRKLAIIPSMSPGTTDSVFFRREGIASYGVSGIFMKSSDNFAHGLNERVPVDAVPFALDHWHKLLTLLSR